MKTTTESPDYKKIFTDIIRLKYPHKEIDCKSILQKKELLSFDIIELNKKIFSGKDKDVLFQKEAHRSYSKNTIVEILNYQEKNKLNNSELSRHFRISRNTISKWKKLSEKKILDIL